MSWSQCLFTIFKILGPFRIALCLFCLCSINGTTKHTVNLVYWIYEAHFWRLLLRKKITFKILLLIDKASGKPQALMEMYNEIYVIFMPTNTKSILQPMDQGIISIFKSSYLRNTFHQAVAAIDGNSCDVYGQSQLKSFCKLFIILYAI